MSKQASKEKSASKSSAEKQTKSTGGSYKEPSYFEQVTGLSAFEQQSWRDNFNNGRAAGDITGATNERLQRERAANLGATESGSSTQRSAAEVRELVSRLPDSVQAQLRGASAERVAQHVAGTMQGNTGPASKATGAVTGVFSGAFGNAMANKPMDLAFGGFDWLAKPNTSNAEDGETRYGDLVSAIHGIAVLGQDVGHNAARMYFGPKYDQLSPGQRLAILGNDGQARTKAAAEASGKFALEAMFGGFAAIEDWGRRNKALEEAAARGAAESDAAWDLRQQLQEIESRKAGDWGYVGSYLN